MPKTCCKTTWFPDRADLVPNSAPDGTPTPDYSGEAFKKSIPGRLIDTGGDETFRGRQLEAHIASVYECRYFKGVLPTMQLQIVAGLFKGRVLNVAFVKVIRETGTVPKLWLYCKEIPTT